MDDHTDRCGAKTKGSGKPCQLRAGWGTSHTGYGYCRLHGGNTPNVEKHAEKLKAAESYAQVLREKDLQDLVAHMRERSDASDLHEEIALLRAALVEFINVADEREKALLRWHASWDPAWQKEMSYIIEELQIAHMEENWERYGRLLEKVPDPLHFMDRPRKVQEKAPIISGMIRDVTQVANAIAAREAQGHIPARDVEVMLVEIANALQRALREHIGDLSTRVGIAEAFQRAVAEIRLPSWESSSGGDDEPRGGYGGGRMDA